MAAGQTIGVLVLARPVTASPRELHERERQVMVALGESLALALANLRLRRTLREQATRDPLTGLYNRRYIEETLERELARATRAQASLAVAMADVDHFKRYNDKYGHDAGDLVLRSVATLLRSHSRVSDAVGRYGGEEFVMVLPEIPSQVCQRRLEHLREQVKSLELLYDDRRLDTVTVSLGLAIFPAHGQTASTLTKAADEALYQAKSAGRDRLIVAA